jgi:periplasmic protein TonB
MQSRHVLFVPGAERVEARAHIILPPPKIEPLHEVFAETMLEDSSTYQRRSPLDWLASIGAHFAILAMLLILPLYFSTRLDFHKLNLTYLAAPATPFVAHPLAPMTPTAAPRPARMAPARALAPHQLAAPTFIPKAVAAAPSGEMAPPDEPLMGIPGGMPGGQTAGFLEVSTKVVLKATPPSVAPIAEAPKVPVFVGANVKPPRLLYGPEPVYPILARQTKLSGIVVIEAVIDEQGRVTGMRVISGHPILIPAALNAVSKRRYEPTIVNGQPTSIDLKVEISFNFS